MSVDPEEVSEAVYNATYGGGVDNKAAIPVARQVERSRKIIVNFLKQISPFATVEELLNALD